MVGDMLAYCIETKTFAVGVGDGDGVGETEGVGVGDATCCGGTVVVLCVQPPMPTTAATAIESAATATRRVCRAGALIDGFPITNCSSRPPTAVLWPSRS